MLVEFSCDCCSPIFSCDCCSPIFSYDCCSPLFPYDCCSRMALSRCLPSIAAAVGYKAVRPLRSPAEEEVVLERVEPAEVIIRNHSKVGRVTRSYSHKRWQRKRA